MVRFPPEQVFRVALVLEPRQPFIDWHDALGAPRYEEVSQDEGETVFLIPELVDPAETQAYIDEYFDTFFTQVLEMHCPDFKLWPRKRTAALFRSWFRVRVHSLVIDVDPAPLRHG